MDLTDPSFFEGSIQAGLNAASSSEAETEMPQPALFETLTNEPAQDTEPNDAERLKQSEAARAAELASLQALMQAPLVGSSINQGDDDSGAGSDTGSFWDTIQAYPTADTVGALGFGADTVAWNDESLRAQSEIDDSVNPWSEQAPNEAGEDVSGKPEELVADTAGLELLWKECLELVNERIEHCASDHNVRRVAGIEEQVSEAVAAAMSQSRYSQTLVSKPDVNEVDWQILDALAKLYELISGTNAAAYELSLVYALSVRIVKLGFEHADTLLTLERICLLYGLIGLGDVASSLRLILEAEGVVPRTQTSEGSRGSSPTSKATTRSKGEKGTRSTASSIASINDLLDKLGTSSQDNAASLIAESRIEIASLAPAAAESFLSKLLESSSGIFGAEHLETAGCLFDLSACHKALERAGYERGFQKSLQIQLKELGPLHRDTLKTAYHYASSCKVWDDSEQGRLRTRAVATGAMSYGLLHARTREIVPPPDKRLIHLEFDSPPEPDAVPPNTGRSSKVILVVDDPQPRSNAERADILMRASRELERHRFMAPDFPQVSEAMHEAQAVYGKLDDESPVWHNPSAVEHLVLALLLELQALKEIDRKNLKEAMQLLETVYKVRAKVLEPGHPDLVLNLFRRGLVSALQNELSQAEELSWPANDLLESVREEQTLLHAAILHNLGALEIRRAAYAPAGKLLERAGSQLEKLNDVALQTKICRDNSERVRRLLTPS